MVSYWKDTLNKKILSHKAIIGIIGLGYVGLPLAELMTKKGFSVIGLERNEKRRNAIQIKQNPKLEVTQDSSRLGACDIVIICIQTPIHEDKTPDLQHLIYATTQVSHFLHKGQLITIESSINPGITRNTVLPILQKSGLQVDEEYFLAFSPERIDPGNTAFSLENIPKVVSGVGENSLALIVVLYKKIFTHVVPVSSLETAEMVKIFENTFRLINISLVNEMKTYADHVGIDMWEVIHAAATKPFGFMPHYPGPGIGGHCIPVDPFYLYDDAKKKGITLGLIERAGEINDNQPYNIVKSTLRIMQQQELQQASVVTAPKTDGVLHQLRQVRLYSSSETMSESRYVGVKGGMHSIYASAMTDPTYRVLLVGISYKPNIDDMRESPALKIWELFEKLGHTVSYHDPYIPQAKGVGSLPLSEEVLSRHDAFVIVTNHKNIDYDYLASFGKPIIDTRHAYTEKLPNIYYV